MGACRYLIWDWNGTLLDDARVCVESMNALLSRRRKRLLTLARYLDIFDFPVERYYQQLGFDFAMEPFQAVAAEFVAEYGRRKDTCGLRDGAMDALQACAEAGMEQCVLSACPQETLSELTERLQVAHFFTRLAGLGDPYGSGKLDNGRQLAKDLGIVDGGARFVGDTTHDFEVARAMGAQCILMCGGHQSRRRLETCGVPVAESLAEAMPLLLAPS